MKYALSPVIVMDNSYLSISDILVTNERVPCRFLHDLPKMGLFHHLKSIICRQRRLNTYWRLIHTGFMDPSAAEDDLKAGATLDVPLWLAENFSSSSRIPLLTVDLPKIYKDAYREILNADACTVDMQKLGQYFYELGCYVAKHDIKGEVKSTLVNTFRQRFRMLMAASVSSDSIGSIQPLSASERRRAAAAAATEKALSGWLQRGDCPLTTANMVANHRKRKRAEMEML